MLIKVKDHYINPDKVLAISTRSGRMTMYMENSEFFLTIADTIPQEELEILAAQIADQINGSVQSFGGPDGEV